MNPSDLTAPNLGKISPELFGSVIAPRLGAERPEVVAGPRAGHDAAVVRIGAGRVMAVTTDPLSIIPALGAARSARWACHLIASDLWTTGIPP
ncbi:MAG: AIR synthase, partial [Candidatus Eisenbacteria bacterium]|nr:AIR synthase [Candidatus Eisenbacteria bacterium]